MGMVDPEQIYEDMIRLYGELPHPVHEPKRCLFYLKMYNYRKKFK